MHVCNVCAYKTEQEGDGRINIKPSRGLLLPEREGTRHPAESGEGESNIERDKERRKRRIE